MNIMHIIFFKCKRYKGVRKELIMAPRTQKIKENLIKKIRKKIKLMKMMINKY